MRLALGQPKNTGSVIENVEATVRLVQLAADAKSDLLVLPELQLSGYDLDGIAEREDLAVTVDDPRLHPLISECVRTSIDVLVGAAVREPEGLVNAILHIDAAGNTELVYRKIHLWDDEATIFQSGQHLKMMMIRGIHIGVAICYDAGFPEVARAYAESQAELLIFCSAFADGEQYHRYRIYHPARALENGVFVAVANAIGQHADQHMIGHSQIWSPTGHLLRDLQNDQLFTTYDISPGQAETERLPYLHDRQDFSLLRLKGTSQ